MYKNTHALWVDIAYRFAQESYSRRKKVGAVLVKDGKILSQGWNGTAPGRPNDCEEVIWDNHQHEGFDQSKMLDDGWEWSAEKQDYFKLQTKQEVIHAEMNCLKHCLRSGVSTLDATLYLTLSPCKECAKMIAGLGLESIVYCEIYRDVEGIKFLREAGENIISYRDVLEKA